MIRTSTSAKEMVIWAAVRTVEQGRQSVAKTSNGTTSCAYRGKGGCRCPVGFLIDDELAIRSDKDRRPADAFEDEEIRRFYRGGDLVNDVRMALSNLQKSHDRCNIPQKFVSEFLSLFEGHFGRGWRQEVEYLVWERAKA